ncbi:hypothetical protein TRFO_16651 [Tritrichomonas foetus]|uniref:Uncharacterized protein n=1 Tax=Tritrichomonas foetus TaxID=1144522 RepID=A0A1J4KTX8_9EUKA|nr:hypothetical protein TRFO_16651 [Tritrichomonas foetus]|eukprot:OHT13220.1 hypothetical protein TRFO_16651 [Tritrichomonas foetus]
MSNNNYIFKHRFLEVLFQKKQVRGVDNVCNGRLDLIEIIDWIVLEFSEICSNKMFLLAFASLTFLICSQPKEEIEWKEEKRNTQEVTQNSADGQIEDINSQLKTKKKKKIVDSTFTLNEKNANPKKKNTPKNHHSLKTNFPTTSKKKTLNQNETQIITDNENQTKKKIHFKDKSSEENKTEDNKKKKNKNEENKKEETKNEENKKKKNKNGENKNEENKQEENKKKKNKNEENKNEETKNEENKLEENKKEENKNEENKKEENKNEENTLSLRDTNQFQIEPTNNSEPTNNVEVTPIYRSHEVQNSQQSSTPVASASNTNSIEFSINTTNNPKRSYVPDPTHAPQKIPVIKESGCSSNKIRDSEGLCVCKSGYIDDHRGCFKCAEICHKDAQCVYPGKCECKNHLIGDGINSCQDSTPSILKINPKSGPTSGGSEVNVTLRDEIPSIATFGFCRFGSSIVKAKTMRGKIVVCVSPPHISEVVNFAFSYNQIQWSKESIPFKFDDDLGFIEWILDQHFILVVIAIVALFFFFKLRGQSVSTRAHERKHDSEAGAGIAIAPIVDNQDYVHSDNDVENEKEPFIPKRREHMD